MKIAKAIREKKRRYISLNELQRLLKDLGIKEKGMTKSGEKILSYNKNQFTITRGNTVGYEINKVAERLAHEITKIDLGYKPGTKPINPSKEEEFMHAKEKLAKRIKQLKR